tara:strand:- start:174 stop:452 length:279 start_codon:yes stop_codon:yes gene_type:complete
MKIHPIQAIQAIEAYKKNGVVEARMKKQLQLTAEQAEHLKEVVNFILEFERADYQDWIRETGNPEAHVYYHAWKLIEPLTEQGFSIEEFKKL